MGWQERLRKSIILVSPEGNRFEAKWQGNDLSVQKRISRVSHPDQDGESYQDLGMGSWDVPLAFFFDGPDHDIKALSFSRAIPERGIWQVTHPVIGLLHLVPTKFTLHVQPVESGNITQVESDWFEPAGDYEYAPNAASASPASRTLGSAASATGSRADPAAAVQASVSALSESAMTDAAQISSEVTSAAAAQSAARQFRKGLDAVKGALRSAGARVTAIMGTINDLTLQPYLDIAAISGAVIQLAESPGLFLGSMASRVSMFVGLGKKIITDLPAAMSFSLDQIASALTGELWLNAVLCGMGTTIVSSLPETRAEALSALRRYRDFSMAATAALDVLAKAAAGNPIEEQYFPRAASAEAVLTLNSAVSRYLMGIAFDLKTEKRIMLSRPENPMMLAIREYGASAAGADAAFDLLCRSNNLHGRELLLLDRGREVVIYA
jgi:hypothetical protein